MSAPLRTPGFASQRHERTPLPGGGWELANRTPFAVPFRTAWEPILHWAKIAPQRLWMAERLADGWARLGYAEAADALRGLLPGLAALGIDRERPLLVLARNGLDTALATYAAQMTGAPVAAVSPQYAQPGADPTRLAAIAQRIAPVAVFADEVQVPAVRACLPRATIVTPMGGNGTVSLSSLRNGAGGTPKPVVDADAALILMTSGSTGRPKAVVCTHAAMTTNMAQVAACFDDDEPPVVVNAAPWSHGVGAISVRQFVVQRGGSLYVDHGQPTADRFATTVDNLLEISPTHQHFVPAGWMLMADALEAHGDLARRFFARLKVMQYGGASLPQSVIDRVQAVARRTIGRGVCVTTSFGATETGPTVANVHWPNERTGLVGLPLPGTRIRLVAAAGGKSEICVSGPQLSPGYWEAGTVVPLPRDDDGFYHLGDAGRLAAEEPPVLVFDGRLVENFKLGSGTFVSAGTLRATLVSALDGLVTDAIICGEGQAGVGVLLFLNGGRCRDLFGDADLPALARHPGVCAGVERGIAGMNAAAIGGSARIARAIILAEEPDRESGEIADKGYLNQALCRARRAAVINHLFEAVPRADVLTFP